MIGLQYVRAYKIRTYASNMGHKFLSIFSARQLFSHQKRPDSSIGIY